jgi:tetratricopeptide (TPR) repeat protein
MAWAVAAGLLVTLGATGVAWKRLAGRDPAERLIPRRVVVGALANRTGDSTLASIGSLVADWITVGLQQAGFADVVPSPTAIQSARYVEREALAGRIRDPVHALARETGAGIVVTGAVYRVGDSLQFHAQVLQGADGSSAGAIEPVAAPASEPGGAIEMLRQRVMGLLASSLDERITMPPGAPPPRFEAYRSFADGLELYVRNQYEEALAGFTRAVSLDSTFVAARLYSAICHSNLGRFAASDSVARSAAAARDRLTDHDRAWLDYLRAQLRGERETALRAIRSAAELAPGSKAAYNTAYVALMVNRPREALAALETLEPDRGPMRGWFQYWVLLCDALHRLGQHERELRAAGQARRLYPERLVAVRMQVAALAALGRVGELEALVGEGATRSARDIEPDRLMADAADELRAHGHTEAAAAMWRSLLAWYEALPPEKAGTREHRAGLATALESLGQLAAARRIVEGLARQSPPSSAYTGWLGELAARDGDRQAAMSYADTLARVSAPYRFGVDHLNRARIAALLGERITAMALLREAYAAGQPIPAHPDWNMDSLRSYAPFIALMRPRE